MTFAYACTPSTYIASLVCYDTLRLVCAVTPARTRRWREGMYTTEMLRSVNNHVFARHKRPRSMTYPEPCTQKLNSAHTHSATKRPYSSTTVEHTRCRAASLQVDHATFAPSARPTPNVTPMARHPPITTREAPMNHLAPPSSDPVSPNTARPRTATSATATSRPVGSWMNEPARSGIRAPAVKAMQETTAA